MTNSTMTIEPMKRNPFDFISTKELRELLKKNLGINAKQASISKGHSNQYLTITVRDPKINIQKVMEFAKSFDTWSMDNTDYVEGQSINISTTKEVDEAHSAPYIEEIKQTIPLCEMETGIHMKNGAVLWLTSHGYYVSSHGQFRTPYVSTWDVQNGTEWAIKSLALNVAKVLLNK